MQMPRKPYPTDVSDEEWSFAAPYLTLMDQHAPQREHDLREVFNALRWLVSEADERERLAMCSINLSGQSLGDDKFLPFVIDQFHRSGIDAFKPRADRKADEESGHGGG